MVRAIYPGAFDPITSGHVDIMSRAGAIFDQVVVGVYSNTQKNVLFNIEERVDLAQRASAHLTNVEVRSFTGLVVEFAREVGATVIVRGLRTGSDFEYEFEMAFMNRRLAPAVDLVCFMTNPEYQFVSSSLLKEVGGLGGDLTGLVPHHIRDAVHQKLGEQPNRRS